MTKASNSEVKQEHKMIDDLNKTHPELIKKSETLTYKGYDYVKLYKKIWNVNGIKPVIGIRNMWKDNDETRVLMDYENVAYNYKGNVYCVCMETGIQREMCVGGFESDRKEHGTLKNFVLLNIMELNVNIWKSVKSSKGLALIFNKIKEFSAQLIEQVINGLESSKNEQLRKGLIVG